MARFLLCLRPTSFKELKEDVIFNMIFYRSGLDIPKTIIYTDKIISYLEKASQHENLLLNVQVYNAFTIGVEITNIRIQREILIVFVTENGIELGYAQHRYQPVQPLEIKPEEQDKFVENKLKELNSGI